MRDTLAVEVDVGAFDNGNLIELRCGRHGGLPMGEREWIRWRRLVAAGGARSARTGGGLSNGRQAAIIQAGGSTTR
jgi:hypothetical protein